jgi:predicted nucleic acid-binding protein
VFVADTNVLVYAVDDRAPEMRDKARALILRGLEDRELRLPHQAIVEFIAVTTRPTRATGEPLLTWEQAHAHAEDLMTSCQVLYPNDLQVRIAMRSRTVFGLSWWDAHMWSYAEYWGIPLLYSEDFQHNRVYGTVLVKDPFVG